MIDILLQNPADITDGLFIGCIGYENRSAFYLKNSTSLDNAEKLIFDYKCSGIYSYGQNMDFIENARNVNNFSDFDEFLVFLQKVLKYKSSRIIFDITSFDRQKIASILKLIFENRLTVDAVKIVYSLRKFVECKIKFEVVNSFSPVLPTFMGDTAFSQQGLSLIMGVGYEYGKVIGAIDTLEPTKTFCFRPTGTDPQFDECIDRANLNFNFLNEEDLVLKYDVCNAETLYFDIRRLVEFEKSSRSVLIVPMGPKIFAAISMLVALIYHPSVKVWRHSTECASDVNTISDAHPTGEIVQFAFSFKQAD